MSWDRVYTIYDVFDVPILGVANVFGQPHAFECPFNSEKDDYEDFYLVSPIDAQLLSVVLEAWEIWLRWSAAFHEGRTPIETHAALPPDRARREELWKIIQPQMNADLANWRKLKAKFQNTHSNVGWHGAQVEWREFDV
jgi:hypothetical protein